MTQIFADQSVVMFAEKMILFDEIDIGEVNEIFGYHQNDS